LIVFSLLLAAIAPAQAQELRPVLSPGDAVVTGFSGIKPPTGPLAPGKTPVDGFVIDTDGPSAQILSLAAMGGQASGQLVTAPALRQLKAGQIGQVFAIALDDGLGAKTPNIYLGATSAFGLQIVAADKDSGQLTRLKKGEPGADWMPGQFGPNDAGPGAIWKVDGTTGDVTLFATLPVNSGPGIGDIVFDKSHKQFFVSDLDTGMIHRITETGDIVEGFDHGTSGRPAKGLSELGDDIRRAQIHDAGFDVEDPSSWGYTQDDRMVWGLAIGEGRLFYAVAGGHQVWSVGIAEDGRFAGDPRWEFDARGLSGDGPITDMAFDTQGHLYLAQRGKARGSYDYSLFAEPEKSSVTRYRREQPDNPATPGVWVEEPEDYAIGMPPEHRHADGGIALGFAHDENGALRLGACGQTLWSTGHRLRPGALADAGLIEAAAKEEAPAQADVHGLQGNDISLVRPQNVPPQQSYFVDYDGYFGDAAKAGHMGDVEIWQPCDGVPAQTVTQLPPGFSPPLSEPPSDFPPDFPPPDYDYEANLKLKKRTLFKDCADWGAGWLCGYRVLVTNTGPDAYFGPILIRDRLPANPAGALMGFSAPWSCFAGPGPSTSHCVRFGVFLDVGASVHMDAYAWVPKSYQQCHLTNIAEIEWAPGGSIWNSDPTDDINDATAHIPAPHCKPKGDTNLKLEKKADPELCHRVGGNFICRYKVTVRNMGPGTYNAHIRVQDDIPAGTTAVFSWGCIGGPPSYVCTHPVVNLAPTEERSLWAWVKVPVGLAKQMNCKVKNRAKIVFAPTGPNNTDPTDDADSAIAQIPQQYCDEPPLTTNLKIRKDRTDKPCLAAAGKWCTVFRVVVTNTGPGVFNGTIKVDEILPAGVTFGTSSPGWTCMGTTCSTTGPVQLNPAPGPGSFTRFYVNVFGPGALAKELDCKLHNRVKIADPVGGNSNTDASDDQDDAVAGLPPEFCQPLRTNLKIEKKASPAFCDRAGNDWWCTYLIRVRNMGPGIYHGPLTIEEALPGEPLDAHWNAPWSCSGLGNGGGGAVCTRQNIVIPRFGVRMLHLRVKFSGDLVKAKTCLLPNVAKITDAAPGSAQNTDPGDDIAGDTAKVPADFCKRQPSNLKLQKYGAQPKCNVTGDGKWRCPYVISIQNMGPGEYNGNIIVKDTLQEAATGATMEVPQNAWNCNGNTGPEIYCTYPAAHLKLLDHLTFNVFVFIDPARYRGCSLRNTALMTVPVGGSTFNTNTADDEMSATLEMPPLLGGDGKAYCYDPEPIQPCPPGFAWNNGNCSRIGTQPPRPPLVGECPDGFVGDYPNCRRVPDGDPHCPPGTVGQYPNCRDDDPGSDPECRGGRIRQNGQCVCPGQLVWNGKSCSRRECPDGMVGRFPRCHKAPSCSGGREERNGRCVCQGQLRWNGKRCVRRECPVGMKGRFPNCHKAPVCTGGRALRGEHCVCPGGTSWNGRRCVRRSCPQGTAGRPPFCRPVRQQHFGNGNGGQFRRGLLRPGSRQPR
jgi:hypothetical protein